MLNTYAAAETRLWAAQKARALSANTPTVLLTDLFTPCDLTIVQRWYTYMYEEGTPNTDAVYGALGAVKSITQELELAA